MYLLRTADLDGVGFNDFLYVTTKMWERTPFTIDPQLREIWPLSQRV